MGENPAGLAVSAHDFGLKGARGWAFRGVSFTAGPGSLIAVEGPSGSGRTSLLLALTGRMRATEGTATVGDARLPRQLAPLRRVSALAHVPGVTDLEPSLTVGEHLRERALLQRRFGGSLRGLLRPRAERVAEARLRVDAALDAAGLDRSALPKGSRTAVRDLDRTEALRLSVALALVGRPRLLGVDDTDLKLSDTERVEIWGLLGSLAAAGTTVLAVCSEAPEGAVVVSTRGAVSPSADGPADAADGEDPGDTAETVPPSDAADAVDPGGATEAVAPGAVAEPTHDSDDSDDPKETGDAFAEARRA
ncbi:ATP-binding cassette domain-containing protein [Streptomyces sp. NPDC088387]|uniref:ABC transporter ATP-binding protein n=1 Tax=Streptomyces sp. NPDC088387 TaxID=3365859 RepID=UPI0038102A80